MGLWFFLSIAVAGHFALKAYKMRMMSYKYSDSDGRMARLEHEISLLKKHNRQDLAERIERLEETVYLEDFELKRQFNKLEAEIGDRQK